METERTVFKEFRMSGKLFLVHPVPVIFEEVQQFNLITHYVIVGTSIEKKISRERNMVFFLILLR